MTCDSLLRRTKRKLFYDITLAEVRARDVLRRSKPPNFLLSISEESMETSGKVYLAIRKLIC
jgi:hypothetical protein